MKIGELARRSGVNASAIRFYESRGLLGAAQRQSNGYRDYPEDAVLALGIINGLQQAGFTLDELRAFVPSDLASWPHDELVARLNRKVDEMRAAEKRLRHSREQLQSVLQFIEAKPEHVDCITQARQVLEDLGKAPWSSRSRTRRSR